MEHRTQIEQEKRLFGSDYHDNDLVFPTPHGHYYMASQVTGRIGKFMQQAGVDASLHSLRHFNASMMLNNSVPLPVVSKRLGHANSQITLNTYSHAMKHGEQPSMRHGLGDKRHHCPNQKTHEHNSAEADVSFCYRKTALFVVNK